VGGPAEGPRRETGRGCGHGECTTAETPCKYEPTQPVSLPEARVRWGPADLDRCEHGRHSIDHCFGCPGGQSTGNVFLLHVLEGKREVRRSHGRVEIRIGTMYSGDPIWVVVRDRPREAGEVTSEEADGKLPCDSCGHRVRPGRHSLAECAQFQQDDAVGRDNGDE
jgi:hypothetical protein